MCKTCVLCVSSARESLKRALDSLGLELQMAKRH